MSKISVRGLDKKVVLSNLFIHLCAEDSGIFFPSVEGMINIATRIWNFDLSDKNEYFDDSILVANHRNKVPGIYGLLERVVNETRAAIRFEKGLEVKKAHAVVSSAAAAVPVVSSAASSAVPTLPSSAAVDPLSPDLGPLKLCFTSSRERAEKEMNRKWAEEVAKLEAKSQAEEAEPRAEAQRAAASKP